MYTPLIIAIIAFIAVALTASSGVRRIRREMDSKSKQNEIPPKDKYTDAKR